MFFFFSWCQNTAVLLALFAITLVPKSRSHLKVILQIGSWWIIRPKSISFIVLDELVADSH